MSAAQALTTSDQLPPALAAAALAVITMGCLGGGRFLLRRRGTGGAPALGWEPLPGDGWLPQQAWAQLPDVQPRPPRHGPRPPAPHGRVPPDGRLWLVRAELAFDQSGGMRSGSFFGRFLLAGLAAGLALLVGAFLVTGDLDVPEQAAVAPILAWLVVATAVSGRRASQNPRRHVALRQLQRELETAYAASPGSIPAGATVRLCEPDTALRPRPGTAGRGGSTAVRPRS